MGLDMYLEKEYYVPLTKVNDNIDHPDLTFKVNLQWSSEAKPKNHTFKKVSGIVCQFMYWRKANAIHKWFVDNCQDGIDECQRTEVPVEDLVRLRELCKEVIAHPEKADELLPTTDGFFFGCTDYDEYYFDDLKRTVEALEGIENEPKEEGSITYYYQSSW